MFGGNGVTGAVLAVGYYALFLGSGMYIGRRLLCKERYSIVMQYLVGSVAGVLALQWFPLLFAFVFDFSMTAHVLALLLQVVLCVLVPLFRIFTTAASISEGERMETFVPGKSGLDLDGSYFCLFLLLSVYTYDRRKC